MKIRINNRINDMPLRCFEFSPTAKEIKFNACSSQSVCGADTAGGGKNHIKQPTDIVRNQQQNNKQQIFINF